MRVCISHRTAFSYLLRVPNPRNSNKRQSRANIVPPRIPDSGSTALLFDALRGTLPEHIGRCDVLVSSEQGRSQTKLLTAHLCTTLLPSASFIPAESWGYDFLVSCPELVFLQMAEELEFDQLIYAGYALCSSFRLSDISPGGCEYRNQHDVPLTSTERIRTYLDRMPAGTRNLDIARRALSHVHNGARSPMEAGIAMLVGMPVRMGGYALGEIEMNREIRVYDGLDRRGKPRWMVRIPDVLVRADDRTGKQHLVGIDYDATSTHTDPLRLEADIDRRNLLASSADFSHITLSVRHTKSFLAFEQEMDRVRRALKQRKKPRMTGDPNSEKNVHAQLQTRSRRIQLWERVLGEERLKL